MRFLFSNRVNKVVKQGHKTVVLGLGMRNKETITHSSYLDASQQTRSSASE